MKISGGSGELNELPRVVIVGGGFGGLNVARRLGSAPVRVTVVDRRNFHLFLPLLYQVATGGLSPANIAAPLRSILRRYKNTQVVLSEVVGIDLQDRRVLLAEGEIPYDTLALAVGAQDHYFGHESWLRLAPGLKTIEDALEIRRRVFLAFEKAERETDPEQAHRWLTFVVIGGGPTGVELAGALAEIAYHTLGADFRCIDPTDAKILLLEGGSRVLPTYPPELSIKAVRQLNQLGVVVRTGAMVSDIRDDAVVFRTAEGVEVVAARTALWAAGVRPSPLGRVLSEAAGVQLDRTGRVVVSPDLSLPGHPEVFVIGDVASCADANGKPLPGLAPVAMQQGCYVAACIRNRLRGKTAPSFQYRDYGTMATIGRRRAVAMIGTWRLSGYPAWLAWLFVHLMYIVGFENRMLVFTQWAWNYLTWNRNARLITETEWPVERTAPPAV
ncbi:MAG: NAD(P)/FAD-dependent oxidoreductase [Isosphaeraceae bacterium]